MRAPRKKIVDYNVGGAASGRILLECGHYSRYYPASGLKKLKKRAECHKCWKELDYDAWLAETKRFSRFR